MRFKKGQIPWNKGLTKENDDRIAIQASNYPQGRLSSDRTWTEDEKEFLKNNYAKIPSMIIAEKLQKKNARIINAKAGRMGLYKKYNYKSLGGKHSIQNMLSIEKKKLKNDPNYLKKKQNILFSNQKGSLKGSNLEKWYENNILKPQKYTYKRQYYVPGFKHLFDFALPNEGYLIEVDGEYIHSRIETQKRDTEIDNFVNFNTYWILIRVREKDLKAFGYPKNNRIVCQND